MFKWMLGFISGVILLYFSVNLINSSEDSLNNYSKLSFLFIGIGLALWFYGLIFKKTYFRHTGLFVVFLYFGFSYACVTAEKLISAQISPFYDQKIIQVTVFLCGLPQRSQYSKSADFCLLNARTLDGHTLSEGGFKARLRWPLDMKDPAGLSVFHIKNRQSRATVNFIGSSFESSFQYNKIILMGSIKALIATEALSSLSLTMRLRYEYHRLRSYVSRYIDTLLEGAIHKGMIRALLIGDKSQLSVRDYKVLANTGTQHLVAISGLHVGLVMLGVFYILPRSLFSIVIVSIVGMAYVLLVGFSPSAQRAWLMCLCALVYVSGYVKQSRWKPFVLALCMVLLLDPLATLNLGFWYSFLCVAIIFLVLQLTKTDLKRWSAVLFLQLLLIVAMAPMNSYLGMKHGLENILANMLAIPWISLLVLPLSLFVVLVSLVSELLSVVLLNGLDISVELLSAYLSSLTLFVVPITVERHALVLFSFIVIFGTLLLFHKVKSMLVLSLLALVVAIVFPSRLYPEKSELIVFDVGQGLALAMKSKDKIWLYDTGPAFEKGSSIRNVILPYLRRHGKSNEFAGLIVSHGDADHAGDLRSLYDEFYPTLALSGQPERLEVSGFEQCRAGMYWERDGFKVEFLYPLLEPDLLDISSNNHSCVIRLSILGKVFLFMGDLEAEAEMALVKYYRHQLKADVLIAGHHGASKGSSYALLKHVKPEYIVFSAGYLNKFGHPSSAVLERVSSFDMHALNTAALGAIKFNFLLGSKGQTKLSTSYARQ